MDGQEAFGGGWRLGGDAGMGEGDRGIGNLPPSLLVALQTNLYGGQENPGKPRNSLGRRQGGSLGKEVFAPLEFGVGGIVEDGLALGDRLADLVEGGGFDRGPVALGGFVAVELVANAIARDPGEVGVFLQALVGKGRFAAGGGGSMSI